MKKWIVSTLAMLVVASALPAAASDLKIGYIVTQRLQTESKVGKEAYTKLKAKEEQLQGTLKKKADELKKLQDDIRKRAAVLNDDEKAKLSDEFESQVRDGKRMEEDARREFEKLQNTLMGELTEKFRGVISKFAKDNGFDLVLDAGLLLYISEKADVTEEVIKLADKSL